MLLLRSPDHARSPDHRIFSPHPLFSNFCCKQRRFSESTLGRRLGGPCVALGWPKGGPRATQTQSQVGRGSQHFPTTKYQQLSTGAWLIANCYLLAAKLSKICLALPSPEAVLEGRAFHIQNQSRNSTS